MADIYVIETGQVSKSEDTSKFINPDGTPKAGFIISPDRTAVREEVKNTEGRVVGHTHTTPKKYWKLSGQALVPMTQAEQDAVDAAETAEATERASKADKERKITKGTRLAAIDALLANSDIDQATRDAWVAEENE